MKSNSIACFIVLLTLLLISCKNDKEGQNKSAKKIVENTVSEDTIFDKKSSYYQFINKNYPKALKEKFIFFKENDIDLDGKNEAIIAFGEDSDAGQIIDDLFVLRNDNGIVKQIVVDFGSGIFTSVKLISLKGKKQTFICLENFEGPYESGFSIFELEANKIKKICASASLGKDNQGFSDDLIDSDKDGKYDGYTQNIEYKYFNLENSFIFENGVFKPTTSKYLLQDYPKEIRDVVLEYMAIKSVKFIDQNLLKRQKEIYSKENSNFFDQYDWSEIYEEIENKPDFIQYEINNGKAFVKIELSKLDKPMENELQFELQNSNDKWKITRIELQY